MELRHLRYFVAVAEERHFGRAAERLLVAQPALSQQIKRLETELGVKLLERTTRRVELTSAGQVLLERARSIIAAASAAEHDCRRAARGEFGRLALGFSGSTTYALMPLVAERLRRELPGVELLLRGEMTTPGQVEALHRGTIDLGVLRPPMRSSALTMEVVRSEPLIVALPSSHPLASQSEIAVGQLAGEPFVTHAVQIRSVLGEVVSEVCAEHGFTPHISVEVNETATLVTFVAAGVGVSLVPASVASMTVLGATYRPLAGVHPRVQIALAWRTGDDSPILAQARHSVMSTARSHPAERLIGEAAR